MKILDPSTCLWLLGFVFVGQYLLYPISQYFRTRFPAAMFRRFEPGPDNTTQVVEELFQQALESLAGVGFELAGHLRSEAPAESRFTLLYNRESKEVASMLAILSPMRVVCFLELTTKFQDGSMLSTNNSPIPPGTFARPPNLLLLRFDFVTEPLDLLGFHRAATREFCPELRISEPDLSDPERWMEEIVRSDLEYQVRRGLLRPTRVRDEYAPTVRGAFLFTWKNAIPVGTIRRWAHGWKMKRLHQRLTSAMDPTVC